jgi:phospholipid/cholesterol/gamma-HCH transport system permease protein
MISSKISYLRLVADLLAWTMRTLVRPSTISFDNLMVQMRLIGLGAVPTVSLMAALAGYVLALVLQFELNRVGKVELVPGMLWVILTEQVVPVGVALVFTGRSVSAVTAELGSMQISEEIKALHTMGIDVFPYLLLPRFLAFQIMLPVVAVMAIYASLLGGWLPCGTILGMSIDDYLYYALNDARLSSVLLAIEKSALFAFIVATISFYKGLNVRNGSQEISAATTQSVVTSVIVVTLANAVVTSFEVVRT